MKPLRTIIFAKAPLAGWAKTRLIPALGAAGAARLASKMLHHTVQTALGANTGTVELCVSPAPSDAVWQQFDLPAQLHWSAQSEGDLGERMAHASERALRQGEATVLIGTDCPALDVATLRLAGQTLSQQDACIIPSFDGGYVLLGLTQFDSSLFQNMPWSTSSVAQITMQRIHTLGWQCKIFPKLHDIDEAVDLAYLPSDWQNLQTYRSRLTYRSRNNSLSKVIDYQQTLASLS